MHRQLLFWAETTLENTKIQVRNTINARLPNWEHILAENLGLSYLKETPILLIKAGISPSDPTRHICAYYHTFVQDPQVSLWEREKKVGLRSVLKTGHIQEVWELLLLESTGIWALMLTTMCSKKRVRVWDRKLLCGSCEGSRDSKSTRESEQNNN